MYELSPTSFFTSDWLFISGSLPTLQLRLQLHRLLLPITGLRVKQLNISDLSKQTINPMQKLTTDVSPPKQPQVETKHSYQLHFRLSVSREWRLTGKTHHLPPLKIKVCFEEEKINLQSYMWTHSAAGLRLDWSKGIQTLDFIFPKLKFEWSPGAPRPGSSARGICPASYEARPDNLIGRIGL